jgi:WS/DGAT/MGAT family acyltransferase
MSGQAVSTNGAAGSPERAADAHMRATDAFTWHMEQDPTLRSTVVAVMWLDRAPDWDVVVDRIDRLSRQVPMMRQRIVEVPWRLATPRWTYDPAFDLLWHLRRVEAPSPHTRETVLEMAREAAMAAFDRARPLWEFTIVEGLLGGEAALLVKMHHSLTDGVGSMQMLPLIFDLERTGDDRGPMPEAPRGEQYDAAAILRDGALTALERTGGFVRDQLVATLPRLAHSVRHPIGTVQSTIAMAGSVYRTTAPMTDTKSPVMRERATVRRVFTLQVPLDELRSAAKSMDSTVNDAFLTAVTGGLRRYHERHDAPVDELRVVVPISIRTGEDVAWGNRITLQRLTVPIDVADPAIRMRLVHSVCRVARDEPSLPVTDTIAGALNLLPAGYVGGLLKHVDFLASNVPGVSIPVYLAGAEVSGIFAFGPTIGASVNVTLVSYQGTCDIGINVDCAAVADPEVLVDCLREGFEEVGQLAAT